MSFCPKCKTYEGPHFAPPSCGEPGFYTCAAPEEQLADKIDEAEHQKNRLTEQYLKQFCNYLGYKRTIAREWLIEHNIALPENI